MFGRHGSFRDYAPSPRRASVFGRPSFARDRWAPRPRSSYAFERWEDDEDDFDEEPLSRGTIAVSRDYRDDSEEVHHRDVDFARGTFRHDDPNARTSVPVSRRDGAFGPHDIDAISERSLRDTRRFLERRKEQAPSALAPLVSTVAAGAGAAGAGYLSQRFRGQPGGSVMGLILGAVAHGAAFAGVIGDYGHALGDGAIAGSVALWVANKNVGAAPQGALPPAAGATSLLGGGQQPLGNQPHVAPAHQPFRAGR